ncbi:iron-siderophore ABC transporter substrate-binding protein [Halobacillus shinanisalinarum]|uniref:Iron-siderophore ABC transporter substrate-binding protein n=1 Tax=Halobacillus shinanisalinarum TaxID=2932258 RepID=A0ABY4H2J8_9BACI|nr:iron-siderophore ABC transporter substrate-binding protein [Halobacillus shinanisalinarum]UOQ94516.1 iron-siderophore ABC transporter substrate-binding protein [Halobacillus shinanisalinarum]
MTKKIGFILFIFSVMVLAACNEESGKDQAASASGEQGSKGTHNTVTIEDGIGKQTIEGVPKRVVVLEWTYVEHLLPLGIEPVGVSDVEGYNKWVNVGEPLADSTTDVGTRAEPNLEAIARLKPDIIIGAKYRHEGIIDELESIAPTVLFAPYSKEGADNQYQHLLDEFNTVAKIFDKQDQAEEVKQNLEQTFKKQGTRIKEAGYKNIEAVVTQAFTSQNTPTMRLFTDNSVVAGVLEKMDVGNAVENDQPEAYGFISTTVEALQNYQDAHLFYLVQEDDNIFSNQFADNPAWTNLDFVKENRTYKLPGDMGTFAGPLSAERLAKEIADSLVEK